MEVPRVDPVGLGEVPASWVQRPRAFPRAVRVVAAAVLAAFVFVGVTTTVLSLGAYCLTSQAGVPAPLERAGPS